MDADLVAIVAVLLPDEDVPGSDISGRGEGAGVGGERILGYAAIMGF